MNLDLLLHIMDTHIKSVDSVDDAYYINFEKDGYKINTIKEHGNFNIGHGSSILNKTQIQKDDKVLGTFISLTYKTSKKLKLYNYSKTRSDVTPKQIKLTNNITYVIRNNDGVPFKESSWVNLMDKDEYFNISIINEIPDYASLEFCSKVRKYIPNTLTLTLNF